MKERTKEEFMARFRGVPPHKVARALTALTPGITFGGCPKGHMAEVWATCDTRYGYQSVRNIELDHIDATIKELYPK